MKIGLHLVTALCVFVSCRGDSAILQLGLAPFSGEIIDSKGLAQGWDVRSAAPGHIAPVHEDLTVLYLNYRTTARIAVSMQLGLKANAVGLKPSVTMVNDPLPLELNAEAHAPQVENRTATLEMSYGCKVGGAFRVLLLLHVTWESPPGRPAEQYQVSWVKQCGSGRSPWIDMAYEGKYTKDKYPQKAFDAAIKSPNSGSTGSVLLPAPSVVMQGKVAARWRPSDVSAGQQDEPPMQVLVGEQVSIFHFWISNGTQFFSAEVVSNRPTVCEPTIAGEKRGKQVKPPRQTLARQNEEASSIAVIYYCRNLGRVLITLTVSLGSFTPVRIQWMKDCGGGRNTQLSVGTMFDQTNVVKKGLVQPEWALKATHAQVRETIVQKNFYIAAEPGAVFECVATTVGEESRICRPEAIVAVHSPGTFKCSVFHNCKEDGLVEVHMVLVQQMYTPVEWSYHKQCNKLMRDDHPVEWSLREWWMLGGGSLFCLLCCQIQQSCCPSLSITSLRRRFCCPRHRHQSYAKVSALSPDSPSPERIHETETEVLVDRLAI